MRNAKTLIITAYVLIIVLFALFFINGLVERSWKDNVTKYIEQDGKTSESFLQLAKSQAEEIQKLKNILIQKNAAFGVPDTAVFNPSFEFEPMVDTVQAN